MTTLDNILDFTGGDKFYRFGNADGKYWIVPARGVRTALNLYQPSGIKGKILKALLPCLHWFAPARKAIKAETVKCRLNSELKELLCKTFGVQNIEFSIFEGTPSASQKITIQISQNDKIIGYCKISDEKNIFELFEKEYNNLKWLNQKGVKEIPQALYCGKVNNLFVFIQSTQKSNNSRVPHKLTMQHVEFINNLHQSTSIEIPFEESELCKEITYLKSIIHNIQECDRSAFEKSIEHIEKHYKKSAKNTFSFFHGDFTPWNMYLEGGELQVFDFEFAGRTFPPRIDLLHFVMQVWILEKKLNADCIYSRLELFKKQYDFSNTSIICYLIHILSFYFKLYKGHFDTKDNGYIIWTTLLKKYIDVIK